MLNSPVGTLAMELVLLSCMYSERLFFTFGSSCSGEVPTQEQRAADANRSMDSLGRLMTDLIA